MRRLRTAHNLDIRKEGFVERCYVCNHCGKCAEQEELLVLICQKCGHEIQPGESTDKCIECGSDDITFSGGEEGAPKR